MAETSKWNPSSTEVASIKGSLLSIQHETTRDRLMESKQSLERRLADINEALMMLDQHPEMERFQDLMRRV